MLKMGKGGISWGEKAGFVKKLKSYRSHDLCIFYSRVLFHVVADNWLDGGL